ncbi:unnamed protein product [Didymodactylos carnosus]|uniref:Integrase zinc-binding domain-containing protein n=1 Tax=Didymodactylos carnosus TaxID=1234261 RepID=A0A8S2E8X2_9BILA|nr:unnamed protein product [Didymodactylos carnosus]CAF3974925.1 unnamed protein product [Didymodactylos carnosus]
MAPNDDDWPPSTDTWDITPTRSPSFFEQLNAVITRHQAKRQTAHTPSSVSTQDPTLSTPLFDLSLDRVYQAQLNDPDIQEKVELLRKHPSQLSLEIKNGILCKLLPRGKIKRALPYIPKALIKDILFTHHDHPLAGHFGTIDDYIRSCHQCARFNIQRQKPPGLLQPIEPPDESFQLAFGRLPRNPFDSPRPDFKFRRPNDYWLHVQRFRAYATQMARRNIQHQQQLSKQRYDLNRNSSSYNIGDLVWFKVLVGRCKLDERFRGPFQITRQLNSLNYTLDDGTTTFTTHVNNLLPVYERQV